MDSNEDCAFHNSGKWYLGKSCPTCGTARCYFCGGTENQPWYYLDIQTSDNELHRHIGHMAHQNCTVRYPVHTYTRCIVLGMGNAI